MDATHPLATPDLLAVWDSAAVLPPAGRAIALVAAACPDRSHEALAQRSVGWRDACLLTLRAWAFGPELDCLADCPRCGDHLELSFQVADVHLPPATEAGPPETVSVVLDSRELRFRLPNSLDLEALAAAGDGVDGVSVLLRRCLLPDPHGQATDLPDPLPDAGVEEVSGRMAEADPQADVELALSCPVCGHAWVAPFDIASYLWSEIDAWARRTLHDVHLLARAYGWREADVLALSARRRRLYLEMIGE
jgi:hypothetical protein